MVHEGDSWAVFFSERGSRWDDMTFDSEEVASASSSLACSPNVTRSKEVLYKSRRRSMPRSEHVFDTKHDRYPLAVHVFLLQEERVLLMRQAGSGYADGQLGLPAVH